MAGYNGGIRENEEHMCRGDGPLSAPAEQSPAAHLQEDGVISARSGRVNDSAILQALEEAHQQLKATNAELQATNAMLVEANALLLALATTDGLTGIGNHRAFQERLSQEWQRSHRHRFSLSVILLDIDEFKSFNDTFGHIEGDNILKSTAEILKNGARETDFVARYGGEEFVALLPQTGIEGAIEAAERFRTAMEDHRWPRRKITASFGVATLTAPEVTVQALIDEADKALYFSKEMGRNRTTHASSLPHRQSACTSKRR